MSNENGVSLTILNLCVDDNKDKNPTEKRNKQTNQKQTKGKKITRSDTRHKMRLARVFP